MNNGVNTVVNTKKVIISLLFYRVIIYENIFILIVYDCFLINSIAYTC